MGDKWFPLKEEEEARALAVHRKALIIDCLGGGAVNPEPPAVDGKVSWTDCSTPEYGHRI